MAVAAGGGVSSSSSEDLMDQSSKRSEWASTPHSCHSVVRRRGVGDDGAGDWRKVALDVVGVVMIAEEYGFFWCE